METVSHPQLGKLEKGRYWRLKEKTGASENRINFCSGALGDVTGDEEGTFGP